MKLPNIFRPKHSIAGRLTLHVMITILLVFTTITAIVFAFTWLVTFALMADNYHGMLDISNEKTNNVFTTVEVAIANTVPEVENSLNEPDKMYQITSRVLNLNPNIVGCAIAFEPNYYTKKGQFFAPYSYRSGDEIMTKQLGTNDYEYHFMDWYLIPKLLGKPGWSEPYYDQGGGNVPMTTYSLPLLDKKGEMYAVITADISIDWIADMIDKIDSVNNNNNFIFADSVGHSFSFIIGRGGTYIVHPDKDRVLNETMFSYIMETPSEKDDSVARKMIAGEKGFTKYIEDGKSYFLFYSPIKHIGWSMAIAIPTDELFATSNVFGIVVLILMGIGLVIVFFVCQHAIRRVTNPLTLFAHSADAIAQGNFEADLPMVRSMDEMNTLRNSFETMQVSLINQIEETRMMNEEKGRIESELHIAHNIQMSMLPKVFPPYPERNDIDIFAQQTPAKEVGGDLYDFYIRDEKLFFCIGDVSGKGVPASLVMAVTRALFRSASAHDNNPAKIVGNINESMANDNELNMFVTLFVGVLDLPTGRLRYCNAGHCAPMLIGAGVGMLPIIPNVPLGIVSGFKFEAEETIVYQETIIFLYTDGLTEAENFQHELYGEERALAVAQEIYSQHDYCPQIIIEQMTKDIKKFVDNAEQSDDLTMMTILYKQKEEQNLWLQKSLTLPNDIETIPQLNVFIDEVAEEIGIDMSLTMSLNLAIEEAVVNVMNYAYSKGKVGDVTIKALADKEWLTFVIIDSGVAFDPTITPEADTTLSVEDRPIGGLGIFLVRQLMDSINYERTDGQNILTVRKRYVKQ